VVVGKDMDWDQVADTSGSSELLSTWRYPESARLTGAHYGTPTINTEERLAFHTHRRDRGFLPRPSLLLTPFFRSSDFTTLTGHEAKLHFWSPAYSVNYQSV